MNVKNLQKGCILAVACFLALAAAFSWIAGDQMRFRDEATDMITAAAPIGELVQGMELRQPFSADADELRRVDILLSTYARTNSAQLVVQVEDTAGNVLTRAAVDTAELADNAVQSIVFDSPAPVERGEKYFLVLSSPDGAPGNAVTAWHGSSISTGRAQAELSLSGEQKLQLDGQTLDGQLCCRLYTRRSLWFGKFYWYLVAAATLCLAGCCAHLIYAAKKGRSTLVLRVISAFQRYGYLMRQLVARDFKTKYKRSVLGIFWSFLNPLLTMAVQYIVFSTLFRSDIPNFPLYLLSGIVCFNFFSEANGMALQSIVGNAALITKVYVPKYIYPVSRVLSSGVNLLLSLIPLFMVMLITGTPLRPSLLLLPFGLICLMAFSIGVGFVLSTSMVFFRDTQFLWGVVSMLWMYLTPVFYPDSIIPERFMPLYKCNPLYHIIRFVRIILMDGVSPEPKAYALCLIASFVPLLAGAYIFKRNQDKFVLNL